MASRLVIDRIALKTLQRYHHATLNCFGDHETLVDAVANRPGFFGPNPVAYLSLLARRKSIHADDLDEALLNDRTLVRATAFRGSLFLLSSSDYPLYFRALHGHLKDNGMERLKSVGVTEAILSKYGKMLLESNFSLPQTQDQIANIIFAGVKKRPGAILEKLAIRKLCDMGILVRTMTKGWKGNDFSFGLTKNWLTETQLTTENPEAARTETIRRYLRCYGPATTDDIGWWTGLPLMQIQRSVSHLRREAVRFPVEGYKEDLIGLRESVELMQNLPDSKDDLEFLPPWDPYTLGWVHRKRLVDKEWHSFVYDAAGNATSVIVEAGKILGLWQFRDTQVNTLEFHVFSSHANRRKAVFHRAEEHAIRLAELTGAGTVNLFERPLPRSLLERPLGSFLWPLGKEPVVSDKENRPSDNLMERRHSNTMRGKYLDNDHMVRPSSDVVDEDSPI